MGGENISQKGNENAWEIYGRNRYLKYILSGILFGYFIFHPLIMVIAHLMKELELDHHHSIIQIIISEFTKSFSYNMLPWALGFAILGGLLGYLTARASHLQYLHIMNTEEYSRNLEKEVVNRTEELQESEKKYRNLFESMHEFFSEIDSKGMIKFVNDTFSMELGYNREDLLGSNFFSYIHPDDIEDITGHCKSLHEDHTPIRNCEYRFRKKDGTYLHLITNGDPLFDSEGKLKTILQVSFDITARKKVEEELKANKLKYSTLVEKGNDGIIIIQKGVLKFINSKMAEIAGLRKEEVLGKPFIDFVSPDYNQLVMERYHRRMAGETMDSKYEIKILSRSGMEMPVEINASIIDYNGQPADMAIIRDITTRKKTEEALDSLRRQLELILNSAGEGIYGINLEGYTTFANPAAAKILGYEVDELIGKSIHKMAHHSWPDGSPYPERECPTKKAILEGIVLHVTEEVFFRKDGKSFPVEYISTPIKENGDISGAVVVFRDITERIKSEEILKKYAKDLEESNRLKDLFRDVMHHDLSNPLTIVEGVAEIKLQEDPGNQELEMILRNAKKSIDLIENATKLSKLELTDNIETEELDLKELIDGVVENLGPLIHEAGMAVDSNIDQTITIKANKIIEEVFVNIITNATKYAKEGKRIIIEGRESGDFVRINIIDFGPGIKDEYKEGIFERFSRKEKKGVKGSGLGLSIAEKVVELHNGKIWIEDNPDGGAVFVVEFPK